MHLSERIASGVISKFIRGGDELPPSPLEKLSDRELEVFRMLGQGKGVRQIAEELGLTIPTINSFRNRIKEKMQLNSSTEVDAPRHPLVTRRIGQMKQPVVRPAGFNRRQQDCPWLAA